MATVPAILNTARLGNFRLGYQPAALKAVREARVGIWLDGVNVRARVHREGFTIHDALNAEPNTCQFIIQTPAPEVGAPLRITLNSNAPRLLFSGTVQATSETFIGRPTQLVAYTVRGIDDLPRGNARLPFWSWVNVSATTVAQQLVLWFAPGFTTVHVQAGLPAISIDLDGSEGMNGALNQIAKLIGGYWYWEERDLHLFTAETLEPPDPIDAAHRFLHDPHIALTSDDSQVRTRVYGKGHGEPTLSEVNAGDTVVPIADAVMFNPLGGRAISETQQLWYSGVALGGSGSVVGTGATPTAAPAVAYAPTSGSLSSGAYQWAYTFVTASGESLPSPVGRKTIQAGVANPTVGITFWYANAGPGGPLKGGFRAFGYTFVTADGETAIGPLKGPYGPYAPGGEYAHPSIPVSLSGGVVIARKYYRTPGMPTLAEATAAALKLCVTINDDTTNNIIDNVEDYALGGAPPTQNQTGGTAAAVSGIATGPAATTARKLYRTTVNGAQLRLVATLADNTTTTYTDTLADGSLGATAPISDTSGLTQPVGKVLPGATSIPVAGAGWALPGGGWAVIGNGTQTVRYTAISGNTLTGVPASGRGAVVSAVEYGSSVTAAPSLLGVVGHQRPILKGAPVNIWVQRDDAAAQAEAAARDGSDGVREHRVVDERRGEASLVALCDADLARYSRPIVTVTYATRDPKTKSGKDVVIDLASPPMHETLTIQDVTITELDTVEGRLPRFAVTASSERYSLEAMLRKMGGLLEGT